MNAPDTRFDRECGTSALVNAVDTGGRAHRILLVADNSREAILVEEQLLSAVEGQFEVVHTASLTGALMAIASDCIDALILDLDLPETGEMDFLRRIKVFAGDLPIVLLSASGERHFARLAISQGASDAIPKNRSSGQLLARSLLHVIERQRARSRARSIEALLEGPDAILVVDPSGIVQYVNRSALSTFQRVHADFLGHHAGFPVEIGGPVELRIANDACERVCEMHVVAFEWHGRPALLATLRDLTRQKQLELQLSMTDRLASLGTIAAGVAHEIKNPLAAVIGNIELTHELLSERCAGMGDIEVLQGLGDARAAAGHIREIVKDLHVFARAEPERREAVDVHRVLDSVIRMAWLQVQHRARLVKDYQRIPPAWGSESRLSQVFLNLIVNAVQAIPEGEVSGNEIRVMTTRTGAGGVSVRIQDSGSGMSSGVKRQLFTPFFTTKADDVGTGLGLAICHRIVTSLGGTIGVTSAPGAGTCIEVILPAPPDDGFSTMVAPPSDPPPAARRARVLVVDDEHAVCKVIERAFVREHDVTCFTRASAALETLRNGARFDVIVCDMTMPELPGMAFCRALEALDALQARRVVMVTGGALTPDARDWLESCEFPQVEKPFDLGVLRRTVNRFLE